MALKSFQAEIERISHTKHAEAIKQAKEAHAAAELAKHHGKKKEPVVKDVGEQGPVHGHGDVPEGEDKLPEVPIEVCTVSPSYPAACLLLNGART